MVSYLVQVTVCMSVFYSFYHIALRKETFFNLNRFYLLITLLISLVLPLIRIYVNLLQAESIVMQAPVYVGSYIQQLDNGITITPEENRLPWKQALMSIYLVGVGVMILRLLLSVQSIRSIKSYASVVMIENHNCVISSKVKSPFSFFNTIYLPASHSFTQEELKDVICHESAHVKGKHSWDVMLLEIVGIVLWPIPLVLLYRHALKEIHEYIADAAVIQQTPWASYSDFLIQQRLQVFQNSLSSHLFYSKLKKRMITMAREKSSGRSIWKYSGIFPLILMLMVFISCRAQNRDIGKVNNDVLSSKEKLDTISVNAQLKYFMNGYSISNDQLESAIFSAANHNLERRVILRIDPTTKVGDLDEVFTMADKVEARMVMMKDEN
jgi:beta-lactamase regulating signal transducer with metallopeptidase domain